MGFMGTNRLHKRCALVAAVLACAITATAAAVDVKGSLRVATDYLEPARAQEADAPRPYYWEEWNGFLDPRPRRVDMRREVTVALIGAAAPAETPPVTVRLWGGSLTPATIVVAPGTTVRIENRDDFAHELYAGELRRPLDGFSNEITSATQARSIRLMRAGNAPIQDKLVPHLTGHVYVIPNLAAVAQPEDDGRFVLHAVAAGTYTLKVFHLGREISSQQVQAAETREMTIDPITLARAAAPRPAPPRRR